MGGACSTQEEKWNAYCILVGKPGKGPTRGWKNNIQMDLRLDGVIRTVII
jgi:hypothetical protein